MTKREQRLEICLRLLVNAVEDFGEAKYLDDDEAMDESGKAVEEALSNARELLGRPHIIGTAILNA